MFRRSLLACTITLLFCAAALADWQNVGPGVDFQEFRESNVDIFVTRIDLTNPAIRVISTRESQRGTRVSDYARTVRALAAINGDYFDAKFNPIGMTVGPCGEWDDALRNKKEGYLAIGDSQAEIVRQSLVSTTASPEPWMTTTISGWPALVVDCQPLTASQLPGSDAFTRAPQPRTAVGLSHDNQTLFFVVADGRRTGVPGLTLAELASFMAGRLSVCSAINLDGGGSSAMWVGNRIVNRPADGVERPVADHLAVVAASDVTACDPADEAMKTTTVTTTKTTVTTTRTIVPPSSTAPPHHR